MIERLIKELSEKKTTSVSNLLSQIESLTNAENKDDQAISDCKRSLFIALLMATFTKNKDAVRMLLASPHLENPNRAVTDEDKDYMIANSSANFSSNMATEFSDHQTPLFNAIFNEDSKSVELFLSDPKVTLSENEINSIREEVTTATGGDWAGDGRKKIFEMLIASDKLPFKNKLDFLKGLSQERLKEVQSDVKLMVVHGLYPAANPLQQAIANRVEEMQEQDDKKFKQGK